MVRVARIADPALALIWRHTHRDFKGTLPDGTRTILVNRGAQGTCLVPLDGLTAQEQASELEFARRMEAKRLQKQAEKKQCNK